ncbi:MAG: NAD(P)H-hydrate epimerase, partial [Flavobacteriales bacterium CG_4_10_14_0_8_um_filter_32_5]
MKILTAAQIREADAYTIKNEPISSIKLMDRAADELVNWLIVHIKIFTRFEYTFFCGVGNNGGDALVMARIFKERKFRAKIYIVESSKNYSPEFEFNLKRLEEVNITPIFLTEENTNFELHENTVIIDAIFGTGLSKPVTGFVAEIIKKINTKEQEIISIDIPSGLYADSNIQNKSEAIIRATRTLSLQQPKLAFFYPENHQFVGDFNIIDIRLHPAFLKEVSTNYFYTTYSEIRYLVKRRTKFAHKGTFGHALLICGSKGKMGAAVLAAKSCMKTGTGLTTALIPEIGLNVLQIAV